MTAKQNDKPVALVTGANRGIGFEVCRQLAQHGLRVLLGARDTEKGQAAAQQLLDEGLDVRYLALDVASDESVKRLPPKSKPRSAGWTFW